MDLDEYGVSVIDFQNNGNPVCFAALARALHIPWIIVVDGDAGRKYLTQIERRGFDAAEVQRRGSVLPAGRLEQQLVADGLQAELKAVLTELGHADADGLDDTSIITRLDATKGSYAPLLSRRCAADPALAARMPEALRTAVTALRGLT